MVSHYELRKPQVQLLKMNFVQIYQFPRSEDYLAMRAKECL
jgi:hypothetical protein